MKIYYAAASPFVRKCLVVAAELGLRDKIELVSAAAHPVNRDKSVVAHNPLGKIPTLLVDDGSALYDSRVICEYLNSLGDGHLLPREGKERWDMLVEQSLADGVCDAAVLTRYETFARPEATTLEGMDRRPAGKGDVRARPHRNARGRFRRPRRPRHDRLRLRARLSRLPLCVARVARHAAARGGVVRAVRRAALDGRHSADIGSPHPIAGTGNAAAGRDIQWS